MKTAQGITPAPVNGLTIPCFATCCSCSRCNGDWPRRKKPRSSRRSDPDVMVVENVSAPFCNPANPFSAKEHPAHTEPSPTDSETSGDKGQPSSQFTSDCTKTAKSEPLAPHKQRAKRRGGNARRKLRRSSAAVAISREGYRRSGDGRPEPLELLIWEPMIDHSITLKYNPHHRTNIGRKATPAVRVYRSDPEGITLQIWHEHEYMSAWLSFADALALADLICKAANEGAAQ